MSGIQNDALQFVQQEEILALKSPYVDVNGNTWNLELVGSAQEVAQLADLRPIFCEATPITQAQASGFRNGLYARVQEQAADPKANDHADLILPTFERPIVHIRINLVEVTQPDSAYRASIIIDPEIIRREDGRACWQFTTAFNDTNRDASINIHCDASPSPVTVMVWVSVGKFGFSSPTIALNSDTTVPNVGNGAEFTCFVWLPQGVDQTSFQLAIDLVIPR